MTTAVYVVAILLVLGVLFFAFLPIVRAYRSYRGARLVTCPATGDPAGIEIDARYAALTAALGTPKFRLKECSRWPEMAGCGEDCLRQVETSPEQCLVLTILTHWYQGKACVLCGKSLGDINWLEHKPALRSPGKKTLVWHEVRPENLNEVLRTHEPICWSCHNAQTFRREHPDLVIDRPWIRPDGRTRL
jgi:hypothetical protein